MPIEIAAIRRRVAGRRGVRRHVAERRQGSDGIDALGEHGHDEHALQSAGAARPGAANTPAGPNQHAKIPRNG
jgi:hypothetical protein